MAHFFKKQDLFTFYLELFVIPYDENYLKPMVFAMMGLNGLIYYFYAIVGSAYFQLKKNEEKNYSGTGLHDFNDTNSHNHIPSPRLDYLIYWCSLMVIWYFSS